MLQFIKKFYRHWVKMHCGRGAAVAMNPSSDRLELVKHKAQVGKTGKQLTLRAHVLMASLANKKSLCASVRDVWK